jgi:glycosyltransferase involved in cell wall biosynthesis
VRIVLINYAYDGAIGDPGETIARHATATGWAEAVAASGAGAVVVAWRFSRDADVERGGVRYLFRRDADGPMAGARTAPRALHQAVAASRPDLVHVNGLVFPSQVRQLRDCLPRACPIVVQDHAGVQPGPIAWWRVRARWRRRAMREGLQSADAFLFTSIAQGRAWQDAGVIATNQAIHAAVESSTTMRAIDREEARRASGVNGAPAILWVGRLNDNKDPLTVLDGFERALSRLPGARLSMVFSEAPLVEPVRDRIRRSAALSDRVRLCGRVDHDRLAAFYSAADLFVLGSHHEGSGYALIEALACGCVPVVTSIPSFRAITADGSVGALWASGDGAGCAEALARAAQVGLDAERSAATAHFEEQLSWTAIGRRAVDIYKEVGTARAGRDRERSG